MRKVFAVALLFITVLCLATFAQESEKKDGKAAETKTAEARSPEPAKLLAYYRLDFTVNELDEGKKVNSRSYSMLIEAPSRGSFKVGSRVPVPTGGASSNQQFQYMDVGVNFNNIHAAEKEGLLVVSILGDLTSMATSEQPNLQLPPIVRSARFEGTAAAVPGKPTVLFSLDDVNSKHRFQIELTATKLR